MTKTKFELFFIIKRNLYNVNKEKKNMSVVSKTKKGGKFIIVDMKNSASQFAVTQLPSTSSSTLPQLPQLTIKKMPNGDILEGKFVSADRFEGKWTFPSGEVEEGVFIDNELIKGTILSDDMILYSGSFIGYKLCGDNCSIERPLVVQVDGKYKYEIKKEEGRFFEDVLSRGVRDYYYSPNDVKREEGMFINKVLNKGKREYIGTDDCKSHILSEEGTFVNNVLVEGKQTHANGYVYEGKFVDNSLVEGKVIYSTGQYYEGKFVNGKISEGKVTFPDGQWYEGEFVDGDVHGNGIGKYNDGIIEGKFVGGYFTEGKYTKNNGDVYEGKFNKNRCITSGKIIKCGGKIIKISNKFRCGCIYGNGVLLTLSKKYVGLFTNDKLNGYGKVYFRNIDMVEDPSLINATVAECKIPYELKVDGLFKCNKLIDGVTYYTLPNYSKISVTTGGVVHKMDDL